MIVRTLKDAVAVDIFEDAQAYRLVAIEDGMGHSLYDVTLGTGDHTTIRPEYLSHFKAQAYYCLQGKGVAKLDGEEYPMTPGSLVATTAANPVVLTGHSIFCFAAIFNTEEAISTTVVRHLDEVLGTERDVAWGNGQSRRMLVRKDGLGFAFCVTLGHSNTDSHIQYRNHYESCYYIQGSGEYEWGEGKHPIDTDTDQGTVFIMNEHDTHNMRVRDESICLSIFTPPIEGNESHDFSADDVSSY